MTVRQRLVGLFLISYLFFGIRAQQAFLNMFGHRNLYGMQPIIPFTTSSVRNFNPNTRIPTVGRGSISVDLIPRNQARISAMDSIFSMNSARTLPHVTSPGRNMLPSPTAPQMFQPDMPSAITHSSSSFPVLGNMKQVHQIPEFLKTRQFRVVGNNQPSTMGSFAYIFERLKLANPDLISNRPQENPNSLSSNIAQLPEQKQDNFMSLGTRKPGEFGTSLISSNVAGTINNETPKLNSNEQKPNVNGAEWDLKKEQVNTNSNNPQPNSPSEAPLSISNHLATSLSNMGVNLKSSALASVFSGKTQNGNDLLKSPQTENHVQESMTLNTHDVISGKQNNPSTLPNSNVLNNNKINPDILIPEESAFRSIQSEILHAGARSRSDGNSVQKHDLNTQNSQTVSNDQLPFEPQNGVKDISNVFPTGIATSNTLESEPTKEGQHLHNNMQQEMSTHKHISTSFSESEILSLVAVVKELLGTTPERPDLITLLNSLETKLETSKAELAMEQHFASKNSLDTVSKFGKFTNNNIHLGAPPDTSVQIPTMLHEKVHQGGHFPEVTSSNTINLDTHSHMPSDLTQANADKTKMDSGALSTNSMSELEKLRRLFEIEHSQNGNPIGIESAPFHVTEMNSISNIPTRGFTSTPGTSVSFQARNHRIEQQRNWSIGDKVEPNLVGGSMSSAWQNNPLSSASPTQTTNGSSNLSINQNLSDGHSLDTHKTGHSNIQKIIPLNQNLKNVPDLSSVDANAMLEGLLREIGGSLTFR